MNPELTRVLELVNTGREALNLPPLDGLPKGMPSDSCRCVIAAAFPASMVDSTAIGYMDDIEAPKKLAAAWKLATPDTYASWIELPKEIKDFIRDFDAGKYPQLVDCELKREDFVIFYADELSLFMWKHRKTKLISDGFPFRDSAREDLYNFFERAGI